MKDKLDEKDLAIVQHVVTEQIKETNDKLLDLYLNLTEKELTDDKNKGECIVTLLVTQASAHLHSIIFEILLNSEIGCSLDEFIDRFLRTMKGFLSESLDQKFLDQIKEFKKNNKTYKH